MNNVPVEFAGMGFVLVILTLLTVLIVSVVWQGFKSWQIKTASKAEIARDEAYRKLAAEAVSVQQKLAEDQQRMVKDLSEMKERINAMEKMLREID